ncbi:glycosyltransferase family 9 protein [Thiohalobacter sp. IOR34]|uniref:glycosyltransferase family 9 protein n=1 Tax=Thiohalobacter sp. IOR34 TaxID=3057176 RepID=UPI0025AF2E39|nr:glycosyltransferase family 9 protein [Thiohalobacter sp. IOR34]WJW75267.1 glycosyltransferase family 9 protein [Thiohalobacter sp. IOR34]
MQPTAEPHSLLVYSNGDTFGDALIKLPAIGALRHAFPEAHITWLAGRGPSLYRGALAPLAEPWLDEVLADTGVGARWSELLRRPLGGRRFDLLIDTQQFLKTTLILRRIRHGLFISGAAGFRLSDRRPAGGRRPRGMLARLLQLVELAAGRPVEPIYRLALPARWREAAARLLPAGSRYVGLAPGAGQPQKCWPLERFIELGRRQAERGRVPVFFIGPDEQPWMEAIRTALPEARFPEWEEAGTGGPLLAIALAERLAVSVANDAGTGHMLAAGGQPLISLFGPTDPAKFAPNSQRLQLIRARDFGADAMDAIPLEAVDAALEAALQATEATS